MAKSKSRASKRTPSKSKTPKKAKKTIAKPPKKAA
jgi:hypothetical protein